MAIRFVNEYCDKVRYVITTNDDVVINFWEILKSVNVYLSSGKPREETERTIICKVVHHAEVVRDPKEKW